jgi:hypothetical protein
MLSVGDVVGYSGHVTAKQYELETFTELTELIRVPLKDYDAIVRDADKDISVTYNEGQVVSVFERRETESVSNFLIVKILMD